MIAWIYLESYQNVLLEKVPQGKMLVLWLPINHFGEHRKKNKQTCLSYKLSWLMLWLFALWLHTWQTKNIQHQLSESSQGNIAYMPKKKKALYMLLLVIIAIADCANWLIFCTSDSFWQLKRREHPWKE